MISLILSIVSLILGYLFYSKYIAKLLKINPNSITPAYAKQDNVDYVPLNKNKNALIQLLNIAGTGPVFGPILAALYGPVVLLWIVVGAIFAGAVHDFMIGMISLRNNGGTLPTLAQIFFGKPAKHIVNFFTALLLLLVATVFVVGPANLLFNLFGVIPFALIIIIIFLYYLASTLLPIDKIIGKFYPYIGALFIITTLMLLVYLIFSEIKIPEINLKNMHPQGLPIFPLLFLVLSCGALSGFHATQSPLIARTLKNENEARYVFYGMMITEGVIALVWASITLSLLDGQTLLQLIKQGTPSLVVATVSKMALGSFLSVFIVLGVVILPLTSGDTAFRSLRLMTGEYLNINQKKLLNRLVIAIPFFVVSIALTFVDFQVLWRYFSWANQTLASISLWIATAYLIKEKQNFIATLIPAFFITTVILTFLLYSPIGFAVDINISIMISILLSIIISVLVIKKQYIK
jgi:carbon starvation protein CstA